MPAPTTTTHVLAIAGSLRRASHNQLLLEVAAGLEIPGVAITVYRKLAALPMFDEDAEAIASSTDAATHLRSAIASADGLMIATPEYNRSVPAVLKNAIDWLSRDGELLWGLPVAVLGASAGPWGTRLAQSALVSVLHATGAAVMPGHDLFVRDAGHVLDHARRRVDDRHEAQLRAFVAAFRDWISCTAQWRARRRATDS